MKENKDKCVEKYDDYCKYRSIINTPFSVDWCKLKNTHCDNKKKSNKK